MIIRGLYEIKADYEQNKYKGRPTPNYVNGTRKDLWMSMKRREDEKARIARLERELEDIRLRENEAYASHQMHLAMGCDDRSCGVC